MNVMPSFWAAIAIGNAALHLGAGRQTKADEIDHAVGVVCLASLGVAWSHVIPNFDAAPAYVNIGAFVDEDTMIDSHALVGSCAQVGKRVHLSASAQIGGVLEPIGNVPVVIEDDVVVGGNCGIYEGTIVRSRAVIGAGVILTGSTPVYDTVRGQIYRRTPDHPLEIPFGAVVIPGARPMKGAFAEEHGLHVATPMIVKYRDEKTDSSTALEDALR